MKMRTVSVRQVVVLISHSRPLKPTYRLCTSCFQVDATSAESPRSATTTARGVPTASPSWRAGSVTTGQVPDSVSAAGIATRTRSHAARVLHIDIRSLAAMSSALASGRVATNGVMP